ncbi:hypothetical protein HPB51_012090 [Rhipicephalus microplus]|uniref:Argonaute linker 1 domain-containing protein n=1 Tax=Rhipicephalus microplus TaxID=6941 RepID=A0A9J6D9L5_RHIMP|nr:hypothetical protein HPB51_012090 [Rhipicephalus microplus]
MANHFSVELPAGNVYYYDVEISENNEEANIPKKHKYRCISTKVNWLAIEQLGKKYHLDFRNCGPVFDGRKNLYTRRELKFRERTFVVDLEEDQRAQKFVTDSVDSNRPVLLQATVSEPGGLSGGGFEVWFGNYTSVLPAQWKAMLNVDMSATTLCEPQPVTSFMCKSLSDGRGDMTAADFRDLQDFQKVRLNKELKDLGVKASTPL